MIVIQSRTNLLLVLKNECVIMCLMITVYYKTRSSNHKDIEKVVKKK